MCQSPPLVCRRYYLCNLTMLRRSLLWTNRLESIKRLFSLTYWTAILFSKGIFEIFNDNLVLLICYFIPLDWLLVLFYLRQKGKKTWKILTLWMANFFRNCKPTNPHRTFDGLVVRYFVQMYCQVQVSLLPYDNQTILVPTLVVTVFEEPKIPIDS